MIKGLMTAVTVALTVAGHAQQALQVMTFNIRYNNPGDSLNAWPHRKDLVAGQILFHEADIVGVQEALHGQIMDLQERLKQYRFIGGGRDDGKERGEYSAVFVDTTRLQILQSQTFWLSPQTGVAGSKGWDAAFPRIVTWARLRDKRTRKTFYFFNTHFDHMGQEARRESAKLLIRKVHDIAGKAPVIVTGDFNAKPGDDPVKIITDRANPQRLTDTKAVSATPHYGPEGTFNAFGPKERDNEPIDYIFVKNGVQTLMHATLSQTWQGRFSSDHFPVWARVALP